MNNKIYKAITKALKGKLSGDRLEKVRKNLTPDEYREWHDIVNYILIEIFNKYDVTTKSFNKLVSHELGDNVTIGGYLDLLVTDNENTRAISFSNTSKLEMALLGHIVNASETHIVSYSGSKVDVVIITKEEAEAMFDSCTKDFIS